MNKDAHLKNSNKESLHHEISELALHDKEMREIAEPYEAPTTGPKWFYLFMVLSLAIGSFYLGRHMGKLDASTHIGFFEKNKPADTSAVTAAQSPASGASLFTSKCASCHQADGKGLPSAFPPLDKSEFVLGNPERLISIVLKGLTGPIEVEGQAFNGTMPAWGEQMSDQELVAVINHIRTKLGNNQAGEIQLQDVQKVREQTASRTQPWQADELKAAYP